MASQQKQDAPLLKEALRIGAVYIQNRGAGQFDPGDSQSVKVAALYHLLVKDNLITPLPSDKETTEQMGHKLAIWISKQLPDDHPLLLEGAAKHL